MENETKIHKLSDGSGWQFKGNGIKMDFYSLYSVEHMKPDNKMALISINTPEAKNTIKYRSWKNNIILEFDDIERKDDYYILFNEDMARNIIRFVLSLPEDIDTIIVHCVAGVSRSGATVRFLQKYMYPSCFNVDFYAKYGSFNSTVFKILEKVWIKEYEETNSRESK